MPEPVEWEEYGPVKRWFLRHPWALVVSGLLLLVMVVAPEALGWWLILWGVLGVLR